MSLFSRACKTTSSSPRSSSPQSNDLLNTVQSLKAALQQHSATSAQSLSRPSHKTSSAVICTVGLAAIAGAAIYATRNPRIPEGVEPVENFDLDRYLGKWYEVARIDHVFEKGLQRTQAEYSRNPNGTIHVTNRGYNPKRGEWKISHGRAKPTIAPDVAALKVSFFGPFYGGYNVVALDTDYQWAMVVGSSLDYFWILSRTPSLPDGIEERLMRQARLMGVNSQKVLWVHQDGANPTGLYRKK